MKQPMTPDEFNEIINHAFFLLTSEEAVQKADESQNAYTTLYQQYMALREAAITIRNAECRSEKHDYKCPAAIADKALRGES